MKPMKNFTWYVYRASCALIRLLFRKPGFSGLENLPQGRPCIVVGNHAHAYGPFYAELYLPFERSTWCIGEMLDLKALPDYAFKDFWSKKPRWCRWFYRLLSYVIAPLCVAVLKNARCIGVYKDYRIMSTMRESLKRMKAGENIVIFPEHEVPHNDIVWEFQKGFVNLASLYARQTGQPIDFVPMYIAPKLRLVCFGKPVAFDPSANPGEEADRVCAALMDAVTALALALPPHLAIPYPNLPKNRYISTESMKGTPSEK